MSVTREVLGLSPEGKNYERFILRDENTGAYVALLNLGCILQEIFVPARNGVLTDVAVGYDTAEEYAATHSFFGAVLGRFANRIGDARFMLDGKEYLLEKTSENGLHHLHGVYAKRLFSCVEAGERALTFRYVSPDNEERFPGELCVEVRYTLGDDNSLGLHYVATTDAPTILNLTNHTYFNLDGQGGSTVLEHKVRLNCSYFSEYTDTFSQTGRIISVDNTPLDFRKEQTIGARFDDDYRQFRICTGYDHNMIIDGKDGELKPIGTAKSDKSGIMLEAFTTEPAIQFYSGNYIQFDTATRGKNGVRYPKNGGLCFEAQHYPDSINHENFPSVVLRPGETYLQTTIYRLKTFEE